MTVEQQWNMDRLLYGLPNTTDARRAFYAGGRHVLTEVIGVFQNATLAEELGDDLLRLNNELHAFTRTKEPAL